MYISNHFSVRINSHGVYGNIRCIHCRRVPIYASIQASDCFYYHVRCIYDQSSDGHKRYQNNFIPYLVRKIVIIIFSRPMFGTNLKTATKCFRWYPRLLSAYVVLHIMAFDFLWTIDSRCSGIFSWWKVLDERSRRHVQNASYALYFCTFISIVHLNYPSSYGCKYFHVIFSYLKCSTT